VGELRPPLKPQKNDEFRHEKDRNSNYNFANSVGRSSSVSLYINITPSFHFYKARTHIKIHTLQFLITNLIIDFLFL
jgi:hypothetical protein